MIGLFTRDVSILAAAETTSRYGDTVKDWDNATTTSAKGWLSITSTTELAEDGREAQVTRTVLSLPAGTAIAGADRVTIDGATYEVDGNPITAYTPRGAHHIEANLRRVEG